MLLMKEREDVAFSRVSQSEVQGRPGGPWDPTRGFSLKKTLSIHIIIH